MNRTALYAVGAFVLGAISGGAAAYFFTKKKAEAKAQAEIDSVKERFTVPRVELKKEESDKKDIAKEFIENKLGVIAEQATKKPSLTEYARKLKDGGYTNYSNTEDSDNKDKIIDASMRSVVIHPNNYGDDETYDQVSLTLYADGILADEDDTILDANEVLGEGNLDHMGEYEDDALHVQNNIRRVYYEVLAEERSYKEATGKDPDNEDSK